MQVQRGRITRVRSHGHARRAAGSLAPAPTFPTAVLPRFSHQLFEEGTYRPISKGNRLAGTWATANGPHGLRDPRGEGLRFPLEPAFHRSLCRQMHREDPASPPPADLTQLPPAQRGTRRDRQEGGVPERRGRFVTAAQGPMGSLSSGACHIPFQKEANSRPHPRGLPARQCLPREHNLTAQRPASF